MIFWRLAGLCLMASVGSPGALIPFINRAAFGPSAVILATGLPSSNGVDFTSSAVCPTSVTQGTVGCAPVSPLSTGVLTYGSTGTGSTPTTLTFLSVPGFTIQGFSLGSSGATRLSLYTTGFDHNSQPQMTYNAPVLSTRNTYDFTNNINTMRVRINLPANVDSFALDLSNGCNTSTNQGGANNCTPEENHMGTILVTAKRVGQALVPTDSVLVTTVDDASTAEFTFFGARSDAGDLEYIDLTLPAFADAPANLVANYGSIMVTRIAFGEATPEPATLLLTAAGLALLLHRRRR